MIFQNEHDLSLAPKCLIIIVLAAAILTARLIMFADIEDIYAWLEPY